MRPLDNRHRISYTMVNKKNVYVNLLEGYGL